MRNEKSPTPIIRKTVALTLCAATLAGLVSCGVKPPAVTTGLTTTDAPTTTEPTKKEITFGQTVYSTPLLAGAVGGPFTDAGSTVYASIAIPNGFGGGYRDFAGKADAAEVTGFTQITAGDIVGFAEASAPPEANEDTLRAYFPALAGTEYTLMKTENEHLPNATLQLYGTFAKEKGIGIYRAYVIAFSADGHHAVPLTFTYTGFSAFQSADVSDVLYHIVDSIRVSSEGFAISLADGLETRSYSLYDNLPDGCDVAAVKRYEENYLAVFVKTNDGAIRVSFFGIAENTLVTDWITVAENASQCAVYEGAEGLIVSPTYGKYYTMTGSPDRVKIQTMTRTFSDAIYSADREFRAHVQAATGSLILENLKTGGSTAVYEPKLAQVRDAAPRSAEPVTFLADNSLIFRIDGKDEVVGFGVYNAATGETEEYKNGLTPLGCSASYLWGLNIIDGVKYEICRLPLSDFNSREALYTKGGDRVKGFFEHYEDIFFSSDLSLNADGSYFVFYPSDDDSRISLFSTRNFECVYTTVVPNMQTVFGFEKQILVATAGWGVVYTIDLPDRTTPGGSFDPSTLGETADYAPDYPSLVSFLDETVPYFYRPANGAASFAGSNIIYYLLNYAAAHGMTEEYDEPEPVIPVTTAPNATGATATASAATVTTQTEPVTRAPAASTGSGTTEPVTTAEEIPPEEPVKRHTVSIYRLKELAWKLLGIREEYFEDYILDVIPQPEEDPILDPATDPEATGDETVTTEAPATTEAPTTTDPTDAPADTPVAPPPDNYYIGLTGTDFYDRETGIFVFTPDADEKSGWSASFGGAIVTQTGNTMSVSVMLRGPGDAMVNVSYTCNAFCDAAGNSYYRLASIGYTDTATTLPSFTLDGVSYAPMWFAIAKGSNRVYTPLVAPAENTGILATPVDEKGSYYNDDELLFGDAIIVGDRALIPVTKNGVYDTLLVEITTGKTSLLSGKSGFGDYSAQIASMKRAGKSYSYNGARLLSVAAGNYRVLLLTSDAVNTLAGRYYVYDVSTGIKTPLSASLSGTAVTSARVEYTQWMGSARIRLAVWETYGRVAQNTCYEWTYSGGRWTGSATAYKTDGVTWSGNAGTNTGTVTGPGSAGTEPSVTTAKIPSDIPTEAYKNFTDLSGAASGVGLSLQEIAESFLIARAEKAAANGYTARSESEYIVTERYDDYIILYENAVMLNADGEPSGRTANCKDICEKKNGEWVWTRIILP